MTLFDRYLVSAVFLIRQYYLYSIQQACFSIIVACKKNQLAVETLSDYHTVSQSSTLRDWIHFYNKWDYQSFTIQLGYEQEIITSLQQQGVCDF